MIRPSALQLAEKCGHASRLAEQFPTASEAAERGTAIHREIAAALASGKVPASPEARVAVAWMDNEIHDDYDAHCEHPVVLVHPMTGETITAGTADVIAITDDDGNGPALVAIDWKTGRPDNVAAPDDNLQLLAYGIAAATAKGVKSMRVCLAFLDGDRIDTRWSRIYEAAEWWPMIDRIERAAGKDDVATPGPHCGGCYQRQHCHAFLLPAIGGPGALEVFTTPGVLSTATAPRALAVVEAMETIVATAKRALKALADEHGPIKSEDGTQEWGPRTVAGRRSGPSVKDCEAAGLGHMVKQGEPSVRYEWRKAAR